MAEVNDRVIKASESGDPDLYPSQSSRVRSGQEVSVREEQRPKKPRMTAVVDEPARIRRKSKFQQTLEDMGSYLWNDILKPALQATVEDLVGNGVHYAIYGEAQGSRGRRRDSSRRLSEELDRRRNRSRRVEYEDDRPIETWRDFTYKTKAKAEEVIWSMKDRADMYNYATILDLYDASKHECNDYTKDYKGWTLDDLNRATFGSYYDRDLRETRWYINLPDPIRIE